jgi:hypothetical protein
MKVRLLGVLAAVLVGSLAFGSTGVDHKSPFFVDGILCEGLEGEDFNQDSLRRNFDDGDKEIADLAVKNLEQSVCDTIFSKLGVEKFQWVSSQTIEQLSFNLKKSGKFEQVDIRLEKSELQNHVYIIGKFKAFEPQKFYQGKFSTEFYRAGESGSDRTVTNLDLKMEIQKQGRENIAPYVIGVKTMQSIAKTPLSLSDWDKIDENKEIDPLLSRHLDRHNGKYTAWSIRLNPKGLAQKTGIFYAMEFSNSQLKSDEMDATGSKFELGWQLVTFDPMYQHRKLELSVFQASFRENGLEIVKEDQNVKASKNLLFVGFTDEWDSSKWINYKIKAYRAMTKDNHYFYNMDYKFTLGELLGVRNRLGFGFDGVKGAVLPEHRFGFSDREEGNFYYQGDNAFTAFSALNKVYFKVGKRWYGTESNNFSPISRDTNYAELGIDTTTKNMDIGLAFTYGGRRVY